VARSDVSRAPPRLEPKWNAIPFRGRSSNARKPDNAAPVRAMPSARLIGSDLGQNSLTRADSYCLGAKEQALELRAFVLR
jgi:hypothetical protein